MRKFVTGLVAVLSLPLPTYAFTKDEAYACVKAGITRFMTGETISNLVDIPYMINNDHITATEPQVEVLLDQKAKENRGKYQNVEFNVVGVPQAKSEGLFLVAGYVWGQEHKDGTWRQFRHSYIVWARPDAESHCRIGRLAIEEIFRLGGWVRQKT